MKIPERRNIFLSNLNKLLWEGTTEGFLIFEAPLYKKFVQFATNGAYLLIDIPFQQIEDPEMESNLRKLLGNQVDNSSGISFQANISVEQAAIFTEKIFLTVYSVPKNYDVEVQIELEG